MDGAATRNKYTYLVLPKHPHITKQVKTTTVQVKTNTLQVKTNTVQVKTNTVQVETTTVQVKTNTVQDLMRIGPCIILIFE